MHDDAIELTVSIRGMMKERAYMYLWAFVKI